MSDDKGDKTTTVAAPAATPTTTTTPITATAQASGTPLPDLMAGGEKGTSTSSAPNVGKALDLDQQALRAAEHALAEGEKAMAAARAQLHSQPKAVVRGSRGREMALRALLAVNVLAMFVVVMLPVPQAGTKTDAGSEEPAVPAHAPKSVDAVARFNEPWNQALAAAERRNFAKAVTILEQYLADSPRMAPSQQLSVMMAVAFYASRNNDYKKAQDYQRRADAIDNSHSLPEDLVAMAKAAADNGDQEALRRVWARFLLQQRQIPSWLYKHVAEAYLQLGDSYRRQANAAGELARLQEIKATADRVREQAKSGEERGK